MIRSLVALMTVWISVLLADFLIIMQALFVRALFAYTEYYKTILVLMLFSITISFLFIYIHNKLRFQILKQEIYKITKLLKQSGPQNAYKNEIPYLYSQRKVNSYIELPLFYIRMLMLLTFIYFEKPEMMALSFVIIATTHPFLLRELHKQAKTETEFLKNLNLSINVDNHVILKDKVVFEERVKLILFGIIQAFPIFSMLVYTYTKQQNIGIFASSLLLFSAMFRVYSEWIHVKKEKLVSENLLEENIGHIENSQKINEIIDKLPSGLVRLPSDRYRNYGIDLLDFEKDARANIFYDSENITETKKIEILSKIQIRSHYQTICIISDNTLVKKYAHFELLDNGTVTVQGVKID